MEILELNLKHFGRFEDYTLNLHAGINVISGGSVYPKMMERHLREELPFIATENILMDCAKRGADLCVVQGVADEEEGLSGGK